MGTPALVTGSLYPLAGVIADLERPTTFRLSVEEPTHGLDVNTVSLTVTDSFGVSQTILTGGAGVITENSSITGFYYTFEGGTDRLNIVFDYPDETILQNGMTYNWTFAVDDLAAVSFSTTWEATLWIGDFAETDHSTDGLTNLLSQYQGKPRIEAFLTAFLDQIDSLENVTVDMIAKRSLFTAENGQLETLGKIVDWDRGDFSLDEEYRLFLTGKIFVDGADGTRGDFIELLTEILYYNVAEVSDYWPCTIRVFADAVTYHNATWRLLKRMCPAGVRLEFTFTDDVEDNVFQTANQLGSNELTETTRGTTTVAGATGGEIAGSYTLQWGEN